MYSFGDPVNLSDPNGHAFQDGFDGADSPDADQGAAGNGMAGGFGHNDDALSDFAEGRLHERMRERYGPVLGELLAGAKIGATEAFGGTVFDALKSTVVGERASSMVSAGNFVGAVSTVGLVAATELLGRVPAARSIRQLEKMGVNVQDLLSSALSPINNQGLSHLALAIDKHAGRTTDSVFSEATGSTSVKNKAAAERAASILGDPNASVSQRSTGRFGQVTDIVSAQFGGMRFGPNGFVGVLEP